MPPPRRKAGRSRITLTTRGVVFDDPVRRAAVAGFLDTVKEVAGQLGHDMLRARFAKTFRHPTGAYESRVTVDRVDSGDRVISDHFVAYGNWLEGTGTRNKTTRFKGYHNFRRTRLDLRKRVTRLAQDKLDELIDQLNGGR